jgi:hypothetical protein
MFVSALYFHLCCLGSDYEQSKLCRLCCVLDPCNDSTNDPTGSAFRVLHDLNNFIKLKGLKIIYQNIQSLRSKINELRLLCTSLRDGLHILTLSETWLSKSITHCSG